MHRATARSLLAATLAAVLLLPAASPPAPAAGEEAGEGLPLLRAPLRLDRLARLGLATFRHSGSDLGSPGAAFDGKPGTVLRTRAVNPAFLEVTFPEPREIESAQAYFPGGAAHEWSLLAGDDPDDLAVVFRQRRVDRDAWSRVVPFRPALRARVIRIVVLRLEGDDFVHFGEIALEARQRPVSLEVATPSDVVTPGGMLPVHARIRWDGGAGTTAVHGLRYETPPRPGIRVEPAGTGDPAGAMIRFERPGTETVRASIAGSRGYRLSSPWKEIRCEPEGRPDWSLGWIERTPRLDFDGPGGGWPAPGDGVLWTAHVRNCGTVDAPGTEVQWLVDGEPVSRERIPGLRRYEAATATLRLPWDGERHEVRCIVDPAGENAELSEGNNDRTVATDSLLLGLWVERPLPEFFHRAQPALGDGAACFEDWAQRQVARWNGMLAAARFPLTPDGVTTRVALDRVVVVEEGTLPLSGGLPTNDPDAADRTVDLQWGFPATLLEDGFYSRGVGRDDANPLWFEGSLLHELSHARTLVDLYRLNVHRHEVLLPGPAGLPLAGSALLPVVEGDMLHRTSSGRMMAGDYAGGYGPHSAFALQRIAGLRARGGNRNAPPALGDYLGDLPLDCGIRVTDREGRPLEGVAVRAWRRAPGPGGAPVFSGDPVRTGETRTGGLLSLTEDGRDPFLEGERGGGLDAGRGVLLLELSRGGRAVYRFLEIVPYNLAFWGGAEALHRETVEVDLP